MKKIVLVAALLAMFSSCQSQQEMAIGKSYGRWKDIGLESMTANRNGGLEYIEVTINNFWRGAKDHNEIVERASAAMRDIEASGMKVWSVHLPYSRTLDISVLNDSLRAENVKFIGEMMEMSAEIFRPGRFVLHPSSEPITPEERPDRLANSHASIGILAEVARKVGVVLCVENLPRTCLGQNSTEMLQLIEGYDDVMLCFDTNHLLFQSHEDFLAGIGNGLIGNVHLSDYDFENERHWIPGEGQIEWGPLWKGIRKAGYEGIFMFECYGEPDQLLEARDMLIREAKKQ